MDSKKTSNSNESTEALANRDALVSKQESKQLANEPLGSYLRRQWRVVREYDLEPTPPPTAVENTAANRIKAILHVNRSENGLLISPELEEIKKTIVGGLVVGFFFGGRYGSKMHTAKYIEDHKAVQYEHVRQAERHLQSHSLYGFGKYAFRWGWRLGLFGGLYCSIMHIVGATRNKQDGLNYLAAGTATGFLYKMFHGWREIVVGVALGTGISIPVALIMQGMYMVIPESVYAAKRQERMQQELQLQEQWRRRLGQTDEEIGKISETLLSAKIDLEIDDTEDEIPEQTSKTETSEIPNDTMVDNRNESNAASEDS